MTPDQRAKRKVKPRPGTALGPEIDIFGNTDTRKMPRHYFSGARELDYSRPIRANAALQNCSICPRFWYVDARFRCAKCGADFWWSARTQQRWFEIYCFWVDSEPSLCLKCNAKRREAQHLQEEYDSLVAGARGGGTLELKWRVVDIVDALEGHFRNLPEKVLKTRELFRQQLAKLGSQQPKRSTLKRSRNPPQSRRKRLTP